MNEFASASLTAEQINAIVKKLGGHDAALKFLRGELLVSEPTRSWREKDGIIYLSVTSDGTTGPQWIERLERKGFYLSDVVKSVLRSPDFKPTTDVATEVAIIKGTLFKDNDRSTQKIRELAMELNFMAPNPEVACLIREKMSNKEIEKICLNWIIVMHQPINFFGDPQLIFVDRVDGQNLFACLGRPGDMRSCESGFAFAVSQVGPQK